MDFSLFLALALKRTRGMSYILFKVIISNLIKFDKKDYFEIFDGGEFFQSVFLNFIWLNFD